MIRKSQLLKIGSLKSKSSEPPHNSKLRQEAKFVRFEDRSQLQYDAEYFVHHASKADLERSAGQGCHLCSLAVSCVWKPIAGNTSKYSAEFAREFLNNKFKDRSEVSASRENTDSQAGIPSRSTDIQCAIYRQKRSLSYNIGYVDSQTDTEADGLTISLQDGSFLCCQSPKYFATANIKLDSAQILPSELSESTGSDHSFETASFWLRQCLDNHQECRVPAATNRALFPGRLLYVEQNDEQLQVQLRETKHMGSTFPYFVLSHCWGSANVLKLTQNSLPTMLSSIPFSTLPKTFQDAIRTTLKLGYSYLWIDSLCIIQDSTSDWAAQSAIMGDIYHNSTLCIAAVASSSGSNGCFRSRNPLSSFACKLGCKEDQTFYANLNSAQIRHKFLVEHAAPLWTRAWVFQETMLSPRTLNFTSDLLFWDCRQLQAWESMPAEEFTDSAVYTPKHYLGRVEGASSDLLRTGRSFSKLKRMRGFWEAIVYEYTTSNLTFEKDRLVALAGVAKLMSRWMGESAYLAGLWRDGQDSLLHYLLWKTSDKGTAPSISTTYIAPSWSWASAAASIVFHQHKDSFKPIANVVEADVTLKDPESLFGEVTDGRLVVSGYLLNATPCQSATDDGTFAFPFGGSLDMNWDTKAPGHDETADGVICLFMSFERFEARGVLRPHACSYAGLMLEPARADSKSFRRRGMFFVGSHDAEWPEIPSGAEEREVVIC
jgi:hypothetical protein